MISDGGFNIGLRLVSPNRFQYVSIRFEIDGPRIWMMTGCSPILGKIHIRGNKKKDPRYHGDMGKLQSWWSGPSWFGFFRMIMDDLCWSKQTHKQYFESWELANGLTHIDMGCVQGMLRHFWVLSHIGKGLATMYSHNHGLVDSYWINGKSLLGIYGKSLLIDL